jgi:hypothetical protein
MNRNQSNKKKRVKEKLKNPIQRVQEETMIGPKEPTSRKVLLLVNKKRTIMIMNISQKGKIQEIANTLGSRKKR